MHYCSHWRLHVLLKHTSTGEVSMLSPILVLVMESNSILVTLNSFENFLLLCALYFNTVN